MQNNRSKNKQNRTTSPAGMSRLGWAGLKAPKQNVKNTTPKAGKFLPAKHVMM